MLPPDRLRKVAANPQTKQQLRIRAQELSRPKGKPGMRR